MNNADKIALKIYKQLDKKGLLKSINILRSEGNVFGAKAKAVFVCTVKGFKYSKDIKITSQSNSSATLNVGYVDKLMVTNSDDSKKIMRDDYFTLDGVKYKILELGNIEDIVFDMFLERM